MPRLGVRLENDPRLSLGDLVDLAQLAEQRGFEFIWVPEGGGRDALTLLTTFARATLNIKLATGILPIFNRTPMTMAMSAAGLAMASGNRFVLGLGTGHKGPVESGHGVPFGRPVGRMRETVEIIRSLLRGDAVTTDGKDFKMQNARLGKAAEGVEVPVYIAALGPQMVALTGQMANGVLLNWTASAYLPTAVEQLQDAAQAAGRSASAVDVAGYVRMAVGGDEAAARRDLQKQISRYASLPFYRDFFAGSGFAKEMQAAGEALEAGDGERAADFISQEMQDEVAVVGSAEHCVAEIERRRLLGLRLPVIAPYAVGADVKESYVRAIEAFQG
ncbi:MAG: LLM class flavin-dependent oxidoreductase [Chloroflexi bacterium]|nr:LLM class flavin-dependent oxidoreductase [Chloroflexota bacterium]